MQVASFWTCHKYVSKLSGLAEGVADRQPSSVDSVPLAAPELTHGGTGAESRAPLPRACNSQYLLSKAPTSFSLVLDPANYGTGPAKEEQVRE